MRQRLLRDVAKLRNVPGWRAGTGQPVQECGVDLLLAASGYDYVQVIRHVDAADDIQPAETVLLDNQVKRRDTDDLILVVPGQQP